MNKNKAKIIISCVAFIVLAAIVILILHIAGSETTQQTENNDLSDDSQEMLPENEQIELENLPEGHVAGGVADVEWDDDEIIDSNQNKPNQTENSNTSPNNTGSNGTVQNGDKQPSNSNQNTNNEPNANNQQNANDQQNANNQPDNNPKDDNTSLNYEEYMTLDAKAQQAYYESFESPEAFFEWYKNAKREYEEENNSIEINGNESIDINDILNGNK